jgi:gamma-carbonic anhydrase
MEPGRTFVVKSALMLSYSLLLCFCACKNLNHSDCACPRRVIIHLRSFVSFFVSVWYGATVRGDVNAVTIGSKTSVGDRAVVHVAKIQGDLPTKIGNNVTIGAAAIVHACTIEDLVVIGESAKIMDGAVVGTNSMIAPGSVVTPNTKVPSGELWSGSPAKKVRTLTSEELAAIAESAHDTLELAYLHSVENSKDYTQLIEEEEDRLDRKLRKEAWFDPNIPDPDDVLGQGVPGRIFNSTFTNPEEGLKLKAEREGKV